MTRGRLWKKPKANGEQRLFLRQILKSPYSEDDREFQN
ncbi:MAG: hypothetical protein RL333_920 [Pseudomonadota bacterium]